MSTIAVPSAIHRWPRTALATVWLLAAILAVTIAVGLTVGRPVRTRTVIRPAAAAQPAAASTEAVTCRFNRPC